MGGSVGKNKSSNRSDYDQDVWAPQGEALEGLYDRVGGLFDSMDFSKFQDLAGEVSGYMGDLYGQSSGGQEHMLGGGSFGDTSDIRNIMLSRMGGESNVGKMYQDIVGGEGNTYIDPMVDAMKSSSMENLDRMQGGSALDAASMGQSGGSRHAMQNAMMARDVNNDMLDRETAMRGNAYDTDLNWKMDIANKADAGNQADLDRMFSMMSGADSNVGSGMGYSSQMQNLGMGMMAPWTQAYQTPWNMASQYSNILGNPTVLGSGTGSGSSKGAGMSGSIWG